MIAAVPADAILIPDLPEWCVGAGVFTDDGWHERHRNGLPRSLADVQGRVTAAVWSSDTEIELEVNWSDPDRGWGDLVDTGAIRLSLTVVPVAERVEVVMLLGDRATVDRVTRLL
jgi:hypothetical protein